MANKVGLLGTALSIAFFCPTAERSREGQTDAEMLPPARMRPNPNFIPARFDRNRDLLERERYGGPGGGPRPPIAPETNEPLPTRKIWTPMIFPILSTGAGVRLHDDYNANRGAIRHTAVDIQAHKMQPIVAPFPGILGFKTQTFWILGDNGYRCLGTRSPIRLRPGTTSPFRRRSSNP